MEQVLDYRFVNYDYLLGLSAGIAGLRDPGERPRRAGRRLAIPVSAWPTGCSAICCPSAGGARC